MWWRLQVRPSMPRRCGRILGRAFRTTWCRLRSVFGAGTVRGLAQRALDCARYGQRTLDQLLVTLNVVEGGLPIFAFPPGTGDALGYGELAKRLKSYTFHAFNFIEAESRLRDYAD